MRLTILMILVTGCGTPESMMMLDDTGPTPDAVSYEEDGGPCTREDSHVPLDTGVLSVVDAGIDAASETDAGAGTDAFIPPDAGADAGTDAPVADAGADAGSDAGADAGSDAGADAGSPPPTRPSTVVELGDSYCFRDVDRHVWCLRRSSPVSPTPDIAVYVGDADRVFGECALVGDEVRCVGASGMLEANGQRGVQIAQHSTSTRGCVIPASRDRAVCWFFEGDVWTFTRAMATFVDAAVPPGTEHAPRVVNLLFHYPWGENAVRHAGAGPVGGGTVDLAALGGFGATFPEPVVTWGSNGNGLCWLGTGGQVRCRTTWNGADGVPIAGGTRWTEFDQDMVCTDGFCRFSRSWDGGSSVSEGTLRHVEREEFYTYEPPSTIRATNLRTTWAVTW